MRAEAVTAGRFSGELVPLDVRTLEDPEGTGELITSDEGIRSDSSIAKLAGLRPAFARTVSSRQRPRLRSQTVPPQY